jgi:hypothetical protein
MKSSNRDSFHPQHIVSQNEQSKEPLSSSLVDLAIR